MVYVASSAGRRILKVKFVKKTGCTPAMLKIIIICYRRLIFYTGKGSSNRGSKLDDLSWNCRVSFFMTTNFFVTQYPDETIWPHRQWVVLECVQLGICNFPSRLNVTSVLLRCKVHIGNMGGEIPHHCRIFSCSKVKANCQKGNSGKKLAIIVAVSEVEVVKRQGKKFGQFYHARSRNRYNH